MNNENNGTPRRNVSATVEQKRLIIEFIKKNPMLASGKFNNEFTHKDSQHLWQKLTSVLNSCPGANKDWKSWRKTWQDIRSRTKVKQSKYRTQRNATGGGVCEIDTITPYETEVLDIIKSVSIEGHTNIKESNIDFSFDDAEPNNMEIKNNEDIMNDSTSVDALSSSLISSNALDMNTVDKVVTEITSKRKLESHTSNKPKVSFKAPRKKLLNASQASENYRISLEEKNKIKKNYYETKLVLLERMTIAKERGMVATEKIADNIEKIAENIEKLASVIEEFV